LDELQLELNTTSTANNTSGQKSLGVAADMTRPEDLVALRETLEKGGLFAGSDDWLLFSLMFVHIEWQGVDTIYICAGVSALRPLLEVADSPQGKKETTLEGIRKTGEIAQKAIDGNFTGPLLAAITFVSHLILHPMWHLTELSQIPQLLRTSPSPSLHIISSVAALIPAPTRSLYCASKASSLMLFRALAIENPGISFSYICPGTIEGNFRASAVDGGDVREVLEGALKSEEVRSLP
jgi:NAD(P)-dependent dehydrogenase (short-subunit alcohol dehydrogenase family)